MENNQFTKSIIPITTSQQYALNSDPQQLSNMIYPDLLASYHSIQMSTLEYALVSTVSNLDFLINLYASLREPTI